MTLKGHQLPNASCEIAHCNLPKPAPFVSFPPTRHYHTQATALVRRLTTSETNAYNIDPPSKMHNLKEPPTL